jgi:triphosphoribosyl-dephospho-CoA synthase
VPDQDIRDEPTQTLRQVMALAADRDLIARQYAHGFREVFDDGVPVLCQQLEQQGSLEAALVYCHVHWLARYPDSLIARKKGLAEAEEAARHARRVLDEGWPHNLKGARALAELDDWLRADERGRNPGTTSDLVTACLFVVLREGILKLPSLPW